MSEEKKYQIKKVQRGPKKYFYYVRMLLKLEKREAELKLAALKEGIVLW